MVVRHVIVVFHAAVERDTDRHKKTSVCKLYFAFLPREVVFELSSEVLLSFLQLVSTKKVSLYKLKLMMWIFER